MKYDVFVFECDGLWDMLGYASIYPLSRFLKLNVCKENILSYSFPYKCDFYEPFLFCSNVDVDPISIYQFAKEHKINLVIVPHKWGPPINREALMRFLDERGC